MEDITGKLSEVAARKPNSAQLKLANRQKSIHFSASLSIIAIFFLLITILHGIGIFIFAKGFLLTRLVLEQKSTCNQPPIATSSSSHNSGCWHPKRFGKAVIVVIDALRYDFTVPQPGSTHFFHNAFPILHETSLRFPDKAFLRPFIADPPTTTLQRLKGLTTGTLPTFIDAGSNFAGTAIEEDNLLDQLRTEGKNLVHLGDDTWHALFPGYFDPNMTHAYDSFNVWDLHSVDNGVTEHIFPLLQSPDTWDVLIAHFLGLDHAGHRYGPEHVATRSKLKEMDDTMRRIIADIDEGTLLVVMGDHGMDSKGDHGGESDDEVEAILWMYSKSPAFGRGHDGITFPPKSAKERPVAQIDLVPTLALLLGVPIPFNNLGAPIPEAFIGTGKQADWKNLATVNALAAAQIYKYQQVYAILRGLGKDVFASANQKWEASEALWNGLREATSSEYAAVSSAFVAYQEDNLRICKSLWARFDIPSMIRGVGILAASLLILLVFARSTLLSSSGPAGAPVYVVHMTVIGTALAFGQAVASFILSGIASVSAVAHNFAYGSIIGFGVAFCRMAGLRELLALLPSSVWGWLALMVTISQSVGFASNSFTIWEDNILHFFLATFAVLTLISSIRRTDGLSRQNGIVQSITFAIMTLLSSYARLCREEQMPYCKSTFYASTTSSTSAPWQLIIPFTIVVALPAMIKTTYQRSANYDGIAEIAVGVLFRVGLLAVAVFWALDSADDHEWLPFSAEVVRNAKIVLSRLILGGSLIVGSSSWSYSNPCITITVAEASPSATYNEDRDSRLTNVKAVHISGTKNAHGTRYFLLLLAVYISLAHLQKPMGNLSMAALTVQLLSLFEIVHENDLQASAIGPIVLAMLGNYHFFKTGHQATLSSIQWDIAFLPLKSIVYPFSPVLVILNAFGAQIITALAIPLLALWRRHPKTTATVLINNVAIALGTFLLYHATIGMATTMWAGHLRRHLMLYRIFSPRFMTAVAVQLVVDLIGGIFSLAAVWCNSASITEIWGWS